MSAPINGILTTNIEISISHCSFLKVVNDFILLDWFLKCFLLFNMHASWIKLPASDQSIVSLRQNPFILPNKFHVIKTSLIRNGNFFITYENTNVEGSVVLKSKKNNVPLNYLVLLVFESNSKLAVVDQYTTGND